MLRKFYINILQICPPHLYAVATLPREIQKSLFNNIVETWLFGFPKVKFNNIIHMYFSLFTLSQNKTNCNHDFELAHLTALPCEMQNSFILWKVHCFPPNLGESENVSCVVWHWWQWKEPVVFCCVTTWMSGKQRHSKCLKWPPCAQIHASVFSPLINGIIHHALLTISPRLNSRGLVYLVYTHLPYVPDAAITRV